METEHGKSPSTESRCNEVNPEPRKSEPERLGTILLDVMKDVEKRILQNRDKK